MRWFCFLAASVSFLILLLGMYCKLQEYWELVHEEYHNESIEYLAKSQIRDLVLTGLITLFFGIWTLFEGLLLFTPNH